MNRLKPISVITASTFHSSRIYIARHSSRLASTPRISIHTSLSRRFFSASPNMSDKKITDWADKSGEFKRQTSSFRDWVSTDKDAKFPVEAGRYHLYVSYACPWAHRALIVRNLKGLQDAITFSSVHWHMGEKGWRFPTKDEEVPGPNTTPDPLHPDFTHIRQVYFESEPDYKDRFTVPVLYDKKQKRIVNNESADIIRMLYTTFDSIIDQKYKDVVLLPKDLESGIDETNEWVYNDINNGVYKSGFATTQEAYEKNVTTLFKSLEKVESHLESQSSKGPYFWGKNITESDVRLYTTIIRFDPVYVQHFKCNLKDIRSGFPYIHRWVRKLYWDVPAFKDTTEFTHIKNHYTKSHPQINPHGITPLGPEKNILDKDEEVGCVGKARI